mmetsp:Transcript_16451/g.47656  ORF Transcript_16451/g.47656 Transcript_16451/m.47656 type:complete len:820 (+) Transcript_16451:79-2538(+)
METGYAACEDTAWQPRRPRSRQGKMSEMSQFHRLAQQLMLTHDTEVAALRAEVIRSRVGSTAEDAMSEQSDLRSFGLRVASASKESSTSESVSDRSCRSRRGMTAQQYTSESSARSCAFSPQKHLQALPTIRSDQTERTGAPPDRRKFVTPVCFKVFGETKASREANVEESAGQEEPEVRAGLVLWPEWAADNEPMLKNRSTSNNFWRRCTARGGGRRGSDKGSLTTESFTFESTDSSSWRRWWTNMLPVHPGSQLRTSWDLLCLSLLIFDIVWSPLQVFDLPKTRATNTWSMVVLVLWTADIPLSFISGYYLPDGNAEMRFRNIIIRYVRSWFPLDLVIVGADWLSTAVDWAAGEGGSDGSGISLARMGKIMRVARILRSLRILRLAKLRQLLYVIEERVQSEFVSILGGLVQQVGGLLALNHLFACLWWLVGTSSGSPSWVEKAQLLDEDESKLLQYLVSLHWSLTQFTPASMEVFPVNIQERGFNVVVLIFAMVVFSSFVSSITSAMTRLRTLRASEVTQSYLLKKYLRENNISPDLSSRVIRYIDLVTDRQKRRTEVGKVQLLQLLSGPLHLELQREVYTPFLEKHSYFEEYANESKAAMGHLCYKALCKVEMSRGDALFHVAADAQQMFFLTSGTLFYRRERGVKDVRRITVVEQGSFFCETVLWMPWVHRGTMKALIEAEIIAMDSAKFREVTRAHPTVARHARRYAVSYREELVKQIDRGRDMWDLPSDLIYSGMEDTRSIHAESQVLSELRGAERVEAMMLMDTSSSESDVDEEDQMSAAGSGFSSRSGTPGNDRGGDIMSLSGSFERERV